MTEGVQRGWGGKRAGSGRPLVLDALELAAIGGAAENLSKRWAERRAHANLRQRINATDYTDLIQAVHSVPVAERRQWIGTFEAEYHADDVEGAIHHLAELEGREATRLLTEPTAQVYGSRRMILRIVARWASWRFKVHVTPSRVDRCWKLHRSYFSGHLDC